MLKSSCSWSDCYEVSMLAVNVSQGVRETSSALLSEKGTDFRVLCLPAARRWRNRCQKFCASCRSWRARAMVTFTFQYLYRSAAHSQVWSPSSFIMQQMFSGFLGSHDTKMSRQNRELDDHVTIQYASRAM